MTDTLCHDNNEAASHICTHWHWNDDPELPPKKEPPDKSALADHLLVRINVAKDSRRPERNRIRTQINRNKRKKSSMMEQSFRESDWIPWIDPFADDNDDDTGDTAETRDSYLAHFAQEGLHCNVLQRSSDNMHDPVDATMPLEHQDPLSADLGTMIQSDTGANACITPCLGILENVYDITPLSVGSVEKDSALQVTKIGVYPMLMNGTVHRIKMLYSPAATGTIISPTAVVRQLGLKGFSKWCNVDDNTGYVKIFSRSGTVMTIPLLGMNDNWYHASNLTPPHSPVMSVNSAEIHRLSDAASYELWHQRLAHCDSSVL